MLAVEMLPAGHGDALIVEYGNESRTWRLLIDAGTAHAYDHVSARLRERDDGRYEVFVITHVDEDHIGGAVRLLNDPDLRHRIRDVWFNGYVHSERGGDVLGPLDGERLTRAIATNGYRWNAPFSDPISPNVGGPVVVQSEGNLPMFDLPGDAKVYLLSPTGKKLKRMAETWEEVALKAGLVPGEGMEGLGRSPKPHIKLGPELPEILSQEELQELAAPTSTDSAAANGSSIAFILEYEGARVLLGADAHPSTLVPSLRRFAKLKGEERVRIDICKLPHHGSRANVTTSLIDAIDTDCYLISTDGMSFGHPDDAAMARILCSSAKPAQIYCNYASDRTIPWVTRAEAVGARVIIPGADPMSVKVF